MMLIDFTELPTGDGMNSKGFFITLAVFLFAIFLVTIIALYNSTMNSYAEKDYLLNKIYQISYQKEVFEKNLLDIFNKTNINWFTDNNKISFLLRIPDNNNREILRKRSKIFADFFYSSLLGSNVTINSNYFYCPNLTIMPYNIDFNNSLCDANALYIKPNTIGYFDFNYYVLDFNLHGQDFNELIENITPCISCKFPLGLKVIVRNSLGIVEATSDNIIDANAYSEIIIKTTAPKENDFNISISSLANLKFFNDSNSFVDINATILFDYNAQEKPFVTMPENVFIVSDLNLTLS